MACRPRADILHPSPLKPFYSLGIPKKKIRDLQLPLQTCDQLGDSQVGHTPSGLPAKPCHRPVSQHWDASYYQGKQLMPLTVQITFPQLKELAIKYIGAGSSELWLCQLNPSPQSLQDLGNA